MSTMVRGRSISAAASIAGVLLVVGACSTVSPEVDLLLRGGTLLDGSGAAARRADVAVDGGKIVAVGSLGHLTAERTIDAADLTIAPGFVDLHSHADLILLAPSPTQQRLLSAKILQGVTTIFVGNCGLGAAPTDERAAGLLEQVNAWMTPDGVRAGPLAVADYLDRLERDGVAVNVGTFVPHGPVRVSAMGLKPGAPSTVELERMRREVEAGLDAGAFGLSAGLIYPPGMYSATDELIDLARVVAARDRLFAAHVRGSSETLLAATEELIEVARRSGARVHHSHLEAVGRRFWPRIPEVLALEDAAREDGLSVSHDVFLYTRAATMMSAIFPPWSLEGGVPALLERLADSRQRRRIRQEIESRVPEWPPWQAGGWPHNLVGAVGWNGIRVASVGEEAPGELVGRSIAEIAEATGREPFDVVADLMLDQRGEVGQQVAEISGDADRTEMLRRILTHPAAAVISDAEDYGHGVPHPAHAGAFARAWRVNRGSALLADPELVRRMTSYPASLVGLRDRGIVREGAAADLVLFDAARFADRSTWAEPRLPAAGVAYVVINGHIAVDGGRHVAGLPGRVLRATD